MFSDSLISNILDINWISCVFFHKNIIVRIPCVFPAKTERTHRGRTADALHQQFVGTLQRTLTEPSFFCYYWNPASVPAVSAKSTLSSTLSAARLDATLSPSDGQAVQLCRIQECSAWGHPTTVIDARAISCSQAIKDSTAQSARLTRLPKHQQVRDASPRVPRKQGDQFTPNKRQPARRRDHL